MHCDCLTLEKAKHIAIFPELYKIFSDVCLLTKIDYDALVFLVQSATTLYLPNVKSFTYDKLYILKK